MMVRSSALFISLVFLLSGCIKEEDFDFTDISTSTWKPDVALPLVNASLDYSDIAGSSDSDLVEVDANGRVTIIRNSPIYERLGKTFFSIPDQQDLYSYVLTVSQANALNVSGVFSDSITYSFPLQLGTGQRLDIADISSGTLVLRFSNSLPYAAIFQVAVPSLTRNGIPFISTYNVPAFGNSIAFTADISGYRLDLLSQTPPNQLVVGVGITVNGTGATVNAGTAFGVTTQLISLDYSYLQGFAGQQNFTVPWDTVNLDIYGEDQNDDYVFSDPRIDLEIENSIGLPAQLANCVVQPVRKDGTPVNGSLLPFSSVYPIDFPTVPGDFRTTTISINSQNSSIVSSYAARPAYVAYTADASINQPQLTPVNFITDSSRIRINLRSELPLDGYANRLTIRDTSDFELDAIGEIDSLMFRIETRNGLPVSGRLQVLFLQNGVVTDSLFHENNLYLIQGTQVDANGFAVGADITVHDEPVSNDRLQRIYDADKVVIYAIMNTTTPPTRVVIRQADHLDVKLGVRARLRIDSE